MLDYGIVGNCKTAALIKKNASVEWMCFPTFSSPSVFAKLLDSKQGGSLEVKPVGKYKITQRYIPNTAILETTFSAPKKSFVVYDFFPRYQKLLKRKKKLVKENKLIRIIKPLKGKPKVRITYDPRPNYAYGDCELKEKKENIVCTAPSEHVSMISNVSFDKIKNKEAFELKSTLYLVVGEESPASEFSVKTCKLIMSATKKYWEGWVKTLILPEQNREQIIRSAITLKLLTFSETGAIVAAATTSIPEEIGTDRTFDYRYCWVRDAAFTVDALKKIGRDNEAKQLIEFILNRVLKDDHIQIMYGIHGETRLRERTLDHLEGYKGSKPVRVGNAAYNQVQNDIYGSLVDIIYLYYVYYHYDHKFTAKHWRFVRYLVNQIKFNWDKRDNGIWEFRGSYQHFTYSKFMCFVGIDRAIKIAQHFNKGDFIDEWAELRDEIRDDICRNGYNSEVQAFTMYYGSKELDAALLQMSYHEFLEPTDPRMINTIKAIYKKLRKDYLVQRYTVEDDFGKSTSAFTICSFWLLDALYQIGEKKKARELYGKLCKRANHLGLFSEDINIKSKQLTGNFPQAYTHISLINSSVLLSEWSTKRKKLDHTAHPKRVKWL